ncbi:ninjurin-1 [Neoarius graeffei]|uniref:ninjurin-1 n=1 Tax=Neoarius graeffei TaxID=443677 RepID=UPI00298C4DF4|nr:ninjurin-1 [Neoarius graeffei]XP_060766110.1 ninjurin-1 [Neoarius graeffei]
MASEAMEMNGAADRHTGDGEVLRPGYYRRRTSSPLNMNNYANKKSAAESMLDVALLLANASQLKAVLEEGPSFSFYTPLIALISISLILQIIVGILLIFIVKWNLNDESKHYQLNTLENISTALVFIIVVVNVFITAFGVQRPKTGA